jgi:hypothetical protein
MRRISRYLLAVVVMVMVTRWGGGASASAEEASPSIQGKWSWTLRNKLGSITFQGSLKAEEAKIAAGAQSSSGQMGLWVAIKQ